MNQDFLANIQQEGELANFESLGNPEENPAELEKEEKETPPASPAETKPKEDETASPAEEEEKDETPEPEKGEKPEVFHAFHEHPRWIAREQELKELRKQNEELLKFRERAEPLLEKLSQSSSERKEIPEWFSSIFGEDETVWEKYKEYSQEQQKQLREELKQEFKPYIEAIEHSKKQNELDAWAAKEWESLENDPQVKTDLKKIGRTLDRETQEEISMVISKYLPTDEETGNLSVRKGFEIWKELNSQIIKSSPSTEEKKKIADTTTKKSVVSEETKDYKTSADFKGKSFADLS